MTRRNPIWQAGAFVASLALSLVIASGRDSPPRGKPPRGKPPATATKPATRPATTTARARTGPATRRGLAPIPLKLPRPVFIGTPKNIPPGTTVEKGTGKPRPPFLAPRGATNVALNRPVTSSDNEPIIGEMEMVTDGNKEATEGNYVELGPKTQWVQIDLGKVCRLHAIVLWHYHADPRVYRDVVVQVADDADFITNVRTLFSNDHDNSSGLGIGRQKEYFDTYEGKLIACAKVKARYLRLYSNGSTADAQNHYIEVEVYGKPAK